MSVNYFFTQIFYSVADIKTLDFTMVLYYICFFEGLHYPVVSIRKEMKIKDRLPGFMQAFPLTIIEDLGFTLIATQGTADFYNANGIKCEVVNKIGGGRPDVVDMIRGLK